jgi:hypothetical protein
MRSWRPCGGRWLGPKERNQGIEWRPVGQGGGLLVLGEFRLAAKQAARRVKPQKIKKLLRKRGRFPENAVQAITKRSRGGPMSRGELYAYFERIGKLGVFFSLYPQL